MGYVIEHFGSRAIGTIFVGTVGIKERFDALEALNAALALTDPPGVLVDFTGAKMDWYGTTDALRFTQEINGKEKPLRRVAYVLRPDQEDMVASVLSLTHGTSTFRRFDNRDAALEWLA